MCVGVYMCMCMCVCENMHVCVDGGMYVYLVSPLGPDDGKSGDSVKPGECTAAALAARSLSRNTAMNGSIVGSSLSGRGEAASRACASSAPAFDSSVITNSSSPAFTRSSTLFVSAANGFSLLLSFPSVFACLSSAASKSGRATSSSSSCVCVWCAHVCVCACVYSCRCV